MSVELREQSLLAEQNDGIPDIPSILVDNNNTITLHSVEKITLFGKFLKHQRELTMI